jgi:hypothetical protein
MAPFDPTATKMPLPKHILESALLVGNGFLQYHWSDDPVAAMAGIAIARIMAAINSMHVQHDSSFDLLLIGRSFIIF